MHHWKLHHLKNLKRSKQSQIVRFANKQECLSHGLLLSYFLFSFSDPERWGVTIHQGWWRLLVYRLDYILETIEVVGPFTVGAMNGVV